jgi:hypothetical protein
MGDKQFDMPEPKEKQIKAVFKQQEEELEEKPNFMDDPPVGCGIPNLSHGGREPQRRSGYPYKPSTIIFTKLKNKAKPTIINKK